MATSVETHVTEDAVRFAEAVVFDDIADEAVRIAKRCVLDGLGLFVAGTAEPSVQITEPSSGIARPNHNAE